MGKKVRTRTKKTSKGLRSSISKSAVRLVRDARTEGDKMKGKVLAWRRGKKGFVTVPNPNPTPDRQFIKVSFERYFGGAYKDLKHRVRPSEDVNKVEI